MVMSRKEMFPSFVFLFYCIDLDVYTEKQIFRVFFFSIFFVFSSDMTVLVSVTSSLLCSATPSSVLSKLPFLVDFSSLFCNAFNLEIFN